ncbi:MAG: hypothetical protein R3F47_07605 [Gammaproteobacteria bacterium]
MIPCWKKCIKSVRQKRQAAAPPEAHIHTDKLANLHINPGNKKVLIFTAFADTANYLYDNLAASLQQTHQLHSARVSGGEPPKSTLRSSVRIPNRADFQSVLTLFSRRRSKARHPAATSRAKSIS